MVVGINNLMSVYSSQEQDNTETLEPTSFTEDLNRSCSFKLF